MLKDSTNLHAVAAVKYRRGILAGEIATLQNQIKWKVEQIKHLDATLTLFGTDPDTVATVKHYKRIALFRQGELCNAVRDVLRRRGKPMTTIEVITGVTVAIGGDDRHIPAMNSRVRAALRYLSVSKGDVRKAAKGRLTVWSLAT
jgi:hypothetical protein